MATWHFGPWLQLSMDEKAGLERMTGEQAFFSSFLTSEFIFRAAQRYLLLGAT
jgi:hypothetical protein